MADVKRCIRNLQDELDVLEKNIDVLNDAMSGILAGIELNEFTPKELSSFEITIGWVVRAVSQLNGAIEKRF